MTSSPQAFFSNPKRIWTLWIVAMLGNAALVLGLGWASEDVRYYRFGEMPGQAPPAPGARPLSEYPDAGTWPLHILTAICRLFPMSWWTWLYTVLFVAMCLGLMAGFLHYLLRSGRVSGAAVWVGVCALLGPVGIARLDLVPGLLVGVAFALALSHPIVSSTALAFATASKLWPGVLAAALVGRWDHRGTWTRISGFVVSLLALCGITIATGGWDRLVSPLTYQGVRGLQVESITATAFLLWILCQRLLHTLGLGGATGGEWSIRFSESKSFEINGPGIPAAVNITDAFMVVALLSAASIGLWFLFSRRWSQRTALAGAMVIVALLICGNKVFSPQYVLWLAPLVCLVLPAGDQRHTTTTTGVTDTAEHTAATAATAAANAAAANTVAVNAAERKLQWLRSRMVALLLAVCALTFLVFPTTYSWLVADSPHSLAIILLTVRNLSFIALTGCVIGYFFQTMRNRTHVTRDYSAQYRDNANDSRTADMALAT